MRIKFGDKIGVMFWKRAYWDEVDNWKAHRSLRRMSKDFMSNNINREVEYKK